MTSWPLQYLFAFVLAAAAADFPYPLPTVLFSCNGDVNRYVNLTTGAWMPDESGGAIGDCDGVDSPNRVSVLDYCKRIYADLVITDAIAETIPVKTMACERGSEPCSESFAIPFRCLTQSPCKAVLPFGTVVKERAPLGKHPIALRLDVTVFDYKCRDGFRLVGRSRRYCAFYREQNKTAFFPVDTPSPVCRQVCPNPLPSTPRHGSVLLRVDQVTNDWTAAYNISCPEGFTLKGPLIRKCPDDGLWEQPEPFCEFSAFPLEENSCTFAGTNDNCTYLNSEKNEINWEAEMNGNPLRRLPQVALPDVQNCSNFLEYEAAARRDGNDDDEEDEDTDILLRRKRQNVAVSSRRLVLVIGITVDVRHATFAVGPFIHPRRDRRSRASFLRFFLSTPGENDGLRYSVTAHALCIPSGRVDNIGRGRFQRLQLLSRQPPRGDYCINIIDRVSTRCERFSIDFTFSVVYPFTPGRPDEVRLVLLPDGISRSRFHCRGARFLNDGNDDDDNDDDDDD
ncbi:uncharacterized protein [Oscarella lobularis]|uniref:uncharacterized protein isoform X1 n=1 Tax=Oscarella lobularis TaxID=121494 RepID=UPI003313EF69